MTHLPNLDSGGKCRPGVKLLCRRQPGVFADTVGQYGTPKCELICQLLRCEEAENAVADIALGIAGGGVWVSAHPKLNEKLVEALLSRGAFDDRLHAAVGRAPSSDSATCPSDKNDPDDDPCRSPVKTQVTMRREATTSVSGGYRPDFVVSHADGASTVLETKQVVDTDYDARTAAEAAEAQAGHPVFFGRGRRRRRRRIHARGDISVGEAEPERPGRRAGGQREGDRTFARVVVHREGEGE